MLTNHVQDHPGFKLTFKPLPLRNLKPTIQNYRKDIENLLPVNKDNPKVKIKVIHTTGMRKALAQYPNKVINTTLPEVIKEEANLPRFTRYRLSQLQFGYCRTLNSYINRIISNIYDCCPLCKNSPHNTNHLFNCPNNPINLNI